jgi:hypothetical protein
MKPKITLAEKDKKGFPKEPDLNLRIYAKLRNWLDGRYGSYSDEIVAYETLKFYPTEHGIDRDEMAKLKPIARKKLRQELAHTFLAARDHDDLPTMPHSAYLFLRQRLAAYIVTKRQYKIHSCLRGVAKRNLAGHLIIEETYRDCDRKRELIYKAWRLAAPIVKSYSISEHWKYTRCLFRLAKQSLRLEIFYDAREWTPKIRLTVPYADEIPLHLKADQ